MQSNPMQYKTEDAVIMDQTMGIFNMSLKTVAKTCYIALAGK